MVRPWVQVFKMKVSIDYKDYIQAQVDGILKAGYNSFISGILQEFTIY